MVPSKELGTSKFDETIMWSRVPQTQPIGRSMLGKIIGMDY